MGSAADWQQTYRPILSKLLNLVDQGNGRARAVCPCDHAGNQPSDLWVSVGAAGELVVRCYPRFSGTPACSPEVVLERLGLSMSYLFPDWEEKERVREEYKRSREQNHLPKGEAVREKPNEPFSVEAQHEYFDLTPEGKPYLSYVIEKRRYASGSKDYPNRRPNRDFDPKVRESKENPAWLWNMTGVTKILYKLPELRVSLAESGNKYVFVLEGEKDVDTARTLQLTATCNPGGVLKWMDSYTKELEGRNVILIPDEDGVMEDINKPGTFRCPGIEHVRDVASKLLGKVKTLKVIRLPGSEAGEDFTDWHNSKVVKAEREKGGGFRVDWRNEIRLLIDSAIPITTPEDILKITPRGEPVWPIPAGKRPVTLPTPVPAAQPSAQIIAPSSPAGPPAEALPRSLLELSVVLGDLRRASPVSPRSLAEWLGEVLMAQKAFEASMWGIANGDHATLRKAALLLAAQLLRGVDGIPEMRSGT